MKFNSEHKVIISSMNQTEAKIFIIFLKTEIVRHYDDIKQAEDLIALVNIKMMEGK